MCFQARKTPSSRLPKFLLRGGARLRFSSASRCTLEIGERFPAGLLLQTMVYTRQVMGPLMELTNEAARRDDRWLFIASLVVLGCFAVATMRYFVRQHERLIEENKEARNDYQSSLRRIVAEQSAGNAKLIICLDNNTQVLEQCRDELRLCRAEKGK